MKVINACSYTSFASDWLTSTHHPRILHIFDRACNLINERREVLSIVTRQIGNGPFNLVIEDDVCFAEHINLKSPVSNYPHQLTLGDLTVHTAGAELWNPHPNWELLRSQKENISSHLTQLPTLAPHASAGVTNHLLTKHQFSNPLISNLFSSFVATDIPTAKSLAAKLAGLGIGLTPSGDDFLMGALYAAWIIHPPDVAGNLAREIAETVAPLTTSLSAAWLRSAGRGEAGVLWHELFGALQSENSVQVQIVFDKILAVGETSGMDALTGFMAVFIGYAEREAKSCHS